MILHVPFTYPVLGRFGKSRSVTEMRVRGEVFVDVPEVDAPPAATWRAESWLGAGGDGGLLIRRGPGGLLAACGASSRRPFEAGPGDGPPADWAERIAAGDRGGWNPFRAFLEPDAPDEAAAPKPTHAVSSGREAGAAAVRGAAARLAIVDGMLHETTGEPYIAVGPAYEAGSPGWAWGTEFRPGEPVDAGRCHRLGDWDAVRARERESAAAYGREPCLPERNPFADVADAGAFALPFEAWHVGQAAAGTFRALAARFAATGKVRHLRPGTFDGPWAPGADLALPEPAEADAYASLGAALGRGLGDGDIPLLERIAGEIAAAVPRQGHGAGEPVERRALREAADDLRSSLARHAARMAESAPDAEALAALSPR